MCVGSAPLLAALMFVRDDTNGGVLSGAIDTVDDSSDGENSGLTAHQPLLDDPNEANAQALRQPEEEHSNLGKFTIFNEIKVCLSSPVLVSLSLGWAAVIGVVASLGTFGGAFVLALQLYDDERDAAWWFGIAAAMSGIIGTPLGGKLADKVLERQGGMNSGTYGEGVDDSFRYPIIASMLSRINVLVAIAMLFIFPTLAMQDPAYFLTFLFIAWTLLFMTQTGINLVAMFSVDRCHRPNAMAFLMLTSHLLGDVPLPILLGLIKDNLAPACRVGASGQFIDPEQCKEQEAGVRQSLAIAYAWIF